VKLKTELQNLQKCSLFTMPSTLLDPMHKNVQLSSWSELCQLLVFTNQHSAIEVFVTGCYETDYL
jgi:hypothetical protein